LDATQLEELSVLAGVELLSVLIDTIDVERAAKGNDGTLRINLVAG
jgi:hypothetical protein